MIVKNEAHIVHELINSISNYFDYWVIVDTGSTDGTQKKIVEIMNCHNKPGKLYQRDWINFGHNRTEALSLAQGNADYIWVMDADDLLVGEINLENLYSDAYYMRVKDNLVYWRAHLFKDGLPFRYDGVLHEVAKCDVEIAEARLDGEYYVHSRRLGGRNKNPNKYLDDAAILEAEVSREPSNSRNVFYLAQSYLNAGKNEEAIAWYKKRIDLGGWQEEVYYSMYAIGVAQQRMGAAWGDSLVSYLEGWNYRPTRIECLYQIAVYYRGDQKYFLGYLYAKEAAKIPQPEDDILFVRSDVYQWRIHDELAVCASWINRKLETFEITTRLLGVKDIPIADLQRIWQNRIICIQDCCSETKKHSSLIKSFIPNPLGNVEIFIDGVEDYDSASITLNSIINSFGALEQVKSVIFNGMNINSTHKLQLLEDYRFVTFCEAPESSDFGVVLKNLASRSGVEHIFYASAGNHIFCMRGLWDKLSKLLDVDHRIVQTCINHYSHNREPIQEQMRTNDSGSTELGLTADHYVLLPDLLPMPSLFNIDRLRKYLINDSQPRPDGIAARYSLADYCDLMK